MPGRLGTCIAIPSAAGQQHACSRSPPSYRATPSDLTLIRGSDGNKFAGILQHLLSLSASCALAAAIGLHSFAAPPAQAITTEQLLFLEAWRAVDRAYVDKTFNNQSWFKLREQYLKNEPMHDRNETYTAISKSIKTLNDPFTRLLEPSRYSALKRGNQGSVIGVGLEVGFREGTDSQLVVVTPAPGGPAEKAGLKSGDVIVSIDGKPTNGLSLYDAGDMLQGAEGSQVTLDVASDSQSSVLKLTRERIALKPVSFQMCGPVSDVVGPAAASGKLAYVRVATFNKQTTESAKAAFRRLKADGASRYILDVRNNGGGLFPAGVELARMLIESGDIVLIADSQGVMDSYEATGTSIDSKAPVAVLVNKGTASASEVMAGALQDNKRATIAGFETWVVHVWQHCGSQPRVPPTDMLTMSSQTYNHCLFQNRSQRRLQPVSTCSLHDKLFTCSPESFKLLQATTYFSEAAAALECFCVS
ncbi:hypothetical protein WJX77_001884 [Trebouxia sp. C0004]